MLERDFSRQVYHASLRHGDEFGIATVAVFAQHLRLDAELFVAPVAVLTLAAGHQVVQADAVAGADPTYLWTDGLDNAGDFMAQRLG